MRLTDSFVCAALVISSAAVLSAQESPGTLQPTVGTIDFGVQLATGLDDVGRYQRFRDPRSGATPDRLRYNRDRESWRFDAALDHIGYRDQRYLASFERFGKIKALFEWNQIPIWNGGQTSAPFREESPGVFRLNDATQLAVQNRTGTIADFTASLQSFDTRSRREVASGRFTYSATPHLDLTAAFTSTARI